MKRVLKSFLALLVMQGLVVSLAAAPTTITYRTFQYSCAAHQKVSISYAKFGKNTDFIVVKYAGNQYALAPALSASGARYANLAAPPLSLMGLEWWEHQGEGTLSSFKTADTSKTTPILTHCKTK